MGCLEGCPVGVGSAAKTSPRMEKRAVVGREISFSFDLETKPKKPLPSRPVAKKRAINAKEDLPSRLKNILETIIFARNALGDFHFHRKILDGENSLHHGLVLKEQRPHTVLIW